MPSDNVQVFVGGASLRARVDQMMVDLGVAMGPHGLHRRCLRRVLALEAHSDAELANMGLRREDILAHVCSDLTAR